MLHAPDEGVAPSHTWWGLTYDPVRTRVSGPTESGLLELTRRRLRPSLIELETVPCPDCGGHGRVVSTG